MLSQKEAELSQTTQEKISPQKMSQSQPPPNQEEFLEVSSKEAPPSTDLPDHFDDLLSPNVANLSIDSTGLGVSAPNFISKDTFHNNICGGLSLAGTMAGLQSLKTDLEDNTARASNDAIYEIILDTPMLHFVLNPQGKWIARISAILAFAVPKAMAVASELEAKQAEQVQPQRQQQSEDVMKSFYEQRQRAEERQAA